MPNYSKKVDSYRTGDVFILNGVIHILSQTGHRIGLLISLGDLSNRYHQPPSSSGIRMENGQDNVSEEELKEMARFQGIDCIGNISDFQLVHIESGKKYDLKQR